MIRKLLIKISYFLIAGSITSLAFCPNCFTLTWDYVFDTIRYYTIIFIILWEIIAYLIKRIDKQLDWITQTRKKIFWNIGLLVICIFPINVSYILIAFEVIGPRPIYTTEFNWIRYYHLSALHFLTAILISLFLNTRNFLESWKKSNRKQEELIKQQATYQLKALQNQVDPHFLFNNLHTLASVFRKDVALGEQFTNQLAKVYRYLLKSNQEPIVNFSQEKNILDAYTFLLEIRFGSYLDIQFEEIPANFKVVPITLQMLIENAIKHNVANREFPLHISIYTENNYLTIQNNVQLKSSVGYSSGIGLQNIIQRYNLLGDQQVIIEENNEQFIVKLPNLEKT